jgi:SpoVK/Ycf46/Vps4 family AAA+-type ATPase
MQQVSSPTPHSPSQIALTAHAADFLKKRVLLVDLQLLEGSRARPAKVFGPSPNEDGDIKAVFQEAELSDAVLFFDECEVIFAKRDVGGNKILNLLLCELERYNGIVFLATNKPLDLDEAMHRRITSVYEFKAPDHCQRRMIWQSYASSSVPLHPDIPWDSIALKYELTGGFIKNAVLSALLRAVSRSSDSPIVLEEDIVHGCSLQMRGSLRLRANSDSIVPIHGLDRLILSDGVRKTMESVISFEKARSVLFGQWRFDETMQYAQGTVMLVTGPHGCGKRAVCEGLAFELGRPMRAIDVSELMLNMTAGEWVFPEV